MVVEWACGGGVVGGGPEASIVYVGSAMTWLWLVVVMDRMCCFV